jgi:hypothetical protein
MAFDRKEFGMNSGIPFIKIADRVEVTVDIFAERTSGPPGDNEQIAKNIISTVFRAQLPSFEKARIST